MHPPPNDPEGPRGAMPRAIWTLGFVSMFMDISSEMIHGLLPIFMVGVLGSSTLAVGLVVARLTDETAAPLAQSRSGV